MKRFAVPAVSCLLGLALGGCDPATLGGGQLMRPAPLVDYSINLPFADPVTGDITYTPPDDDGVSGAFAESGQLAPGGFSPRAVPVLSWKHINPDITSAMQRDFTQDALLQRSDVLCERYLDSMYFRVTLRRTVFGQIGQVASAIGAFSGAGQGANIAALVANIAGGTNNLMDAEILQSQMITLITKQIKTNRDQILGQIMTTRVTERAPTSTTRYPLSLALRDAMNYHQQCSFLAGITGLSIVADKPNPASNAQSQAAITSAAGATAAAIVGAAGTDAAGPIVVVKPAR